MSTENQSNIEALEKKVDELIALSTRLSLENNALKQQLQEIRNDRASLVEQRDQVRHQVEGMITRLKTIETA
jgi:cell division protein ZapB